MIGWSDAPPRSSVCGLFKWRQFEPEVILLGSGVVLALFPFRTVTSRNSLLSADFWSTTSPSGGGSKLRPGNSASIATAARPTNDSWRVDETYIRVKGKWVYLYRAVDSSGP